MYAITEGVIEPRRTRWPHRLHRTPLLMPAQDASPGDAAALIAGRPAVLREASGGRRRLQKVGLAVAQRGNGFGDLLQVNLAGHVQQLDQLDVLPQVGRIVELGGQTCRLRPWLTATDAADGRIVAFLAGPSRSHPLDRGLVARLRLAAKRVLLSAHRPGRGRGAVAGAEPTRREIRGPAAGDGRRQERRARSGRTPDHAINRAGEASLTHRERTETSSSTQRGPT